MGKKRRGRGDQSQGRAKREGDEERRAEEGGEDRQGEGEEIEW